jgi:hypothetical protein
MGIKGRTERTVFSLLICTTFLLRGYSRAGGGGLFIDYFSHSEIANGVFLLALYFQLRFHIVVSLALVGLIFFINAFMGVWAFFVFAAVFFTQLRRAEIPWTEGLLRAAIGACAASVIAAPVVMSIVSNPEFGKPLTFDYVAFLKELSPFHFLIEASDPKDKIALALIAISGALAFWCEGQSARSLLIALIACCIIYAGGAIVPHLTHSPLILNLHLLREGTFIQLLTALAVATLATLWLCDSDPNKNIAGSVIAAAASIPIRSVGLGMLVLFLLYSSIRPQWSDFKRLSDASITALANMKYAVVIWMICAVPILFFQQRTAHSTEQEWIEEWKKIAIWARDNTSPESVFLVPLANWTKDMTPEEAAGRSDTIFEYVSHRRVWVDYKRGAAVMWMPSFYSEWRRRVADVSKLATHQDKLNYAYQKRLNYVIEACFSGPADNVLLVTKRLCVYPAPSEAQGVITPQAK